MGDARAKQNSEAYKSVQQQADFQQMQMMEMQY